MNTTLNETTDVKDAVEQIAVDRIAVNPNQPRRRFSQEELEELAQSIRAVGLIHPPVVRPLPNGKFELVSGERRFRAAQLAGMRKLPVVVRETSYEISAQAALIENVQRVDLNPIEVAKALRSLVEQFGFHQEQLAERIGKKRSTVANYLRLLGLPKSIQDAVSDNTITMGHAKAILSVEGFEKQKELFEVIVSGSMNVRETEEAALHLDKRGKKRTSPSGNRDIYLEEIAARMREQLCTKVAIDGKGTKGTIHIDYYSLDDLDRILAFFEGS